MAQKPVVVDIAGHGDFVSIQDAINSMTDDAKIQRVIFVKNGEYNETLKLCKSAYDSDPFRTDNLIMLAAVHFQLKKYREF